MSSKQSPPTQNPLSILVNEIQQMLGGASPVTVRRMIANGELPPPLELGRTRLWPRKAFEDWLEQSWKALGLAKRDPAAAPTPVFVREPAEHPAGKQPRKLRCGDAATPAPNASIDQQEGGVK